MKIPGGAAFAASVICLSLLTGLANAQSAPGAGGAVRVSLATGGLEANDVSARPAVSADGRFVAFQSYAGNLVPGDTNGYADIFVHDRATGQTGRVSVATNGSQANGHSYAPSISADGRYVVFYSQADNLVENDGNAYNDVFLHDRQTGTTSRVSVAAGGGPPDGGSADPKISADGRYVVFSSLAGNLLAEYQSRTLSRIFVFDGATGQTSLVSAGPDGSTANGHSYRPSLSADGRYVAFDSVATNLVPEDSNGTADVFVYDRTTGQTVRASLGTGGAQADGASLTADISPDGRYVAFQSSATNLVAGDTNGAADVFVRDLQAGQTSRVSLSSGGGQASASSASPSLSRDGKYVAFASPAAELSPGDTNGYADIFVHERATAQTRRVTLGLDGQQANGGSLNPALSADGGLVALASDASNLVASDDNATRDIFVYSLAPVDAVPPVVTAKLSGKQGENGWYVGDVTVQLSADDEAGGSGVKEIIYSVTGPAPAAATNKPATSVQFSISTEGATTVSYSASDNAGNLAPTNTLTVRIDKTAPTITLASPTDGAVYTLNASVAADYTCADKASGVAACTGSAAPGAPLATGSAGKTKFEVEAVDQAGNTARLKVDYAVTYTVEVVREQPKPGKAGSTQAVRVQIRDANGANLSRADLAVRATGISELGEAALLAAAGTGAAAVDGEFRYDSALAGYVYNLRTKDLAAGQWQLWLAVAGDPLPHTVEFELR
ncbi:MAG: hypothetical protein M1401_01725 [Chloroflexi bacterium]|nr:hypothetical protein [Chloroflexota bacterium]